MTAKQAELARPKCGRLFIKSHNVDFILKDELYFTLSNTSLAGNDSDDVQNTPYDVKNKMKTKYEPKLLVWLAGSPRGVSSVKFFKCGLAINIYIRDEWLRKGLIPFIKNIL